ncbi:MAG TPA: phosphoenolpyruvate synthase, partial [Myxococcota bacterium]|nr:phosphoenolpyruvate synthase [Myxococcota bacterium]
MRFVRPFDSLTLDDVPLVGGKNASFGELIRALKPLGVKVPDGFALTADAYKALLDGPGVREGLRNALRGLDPTDVDSLRAAGALARRTLREAPVSPEMQREIEEAYAALSRRYGQEQADVAVRSSATAEDLPTASFAGQQETYLNVHGVPQLVEACRRCFASLFTDRAISYRAERGFDHEKVYLSIGVQKMVRSDQAGSGVMFTLDTESGFDQAVLITAIYGLGENIVQGVVNPDEYIVFKPTMAEISRRLGSKEIAMVYDEGGGRGTRNIAVPESLRREFVLSRDEAVELARQGVAIEKHYSARAGEPRPMDIEWAKDGPSGEIFIVQARPETAHSQRDAAKLVSYSLVERGEVLVRGRAVGTQIGAGPVRRLDHASEMSDFAPGSVLVTAMTDPDWEPILKRASAIVTDRGGRTCHAAIVARELGVPAVVGAEGATAAIATGRSVTVSCAGGETGEVLDGKVAFEVERLSAAELALPHTGIMVNLANPDLAFRTAMLPNAGVGLARMEFIVSEEIRVHPMALVHPERIASTRERAAIEKLAAGFETPADYFVAKLAEGVGTIAAAFFPRPVIVRLSDFKTNEYAALLGGRAFEPVEANPMLGFRGAARYAHPAYAEGFALECRALQRVRGEMGLTNLAVMVPFCRRVEEGRRVIEAMA